ncbi:MAG: hypothetical protein ACK4QL_02620 [Pseudanabaenaceae cyanobacterium]
MPVIPEPLLRALEKFYLEITDVALALTNLSLRVAETAYLMGYQDGLRVIIPTPLANCVMARAVCIQ